MSSLTDERISQEIDQLLRQASADGERWERRRAELREAEESGQETNTDSLVRLGDIFMSVSADEGRLLYLLARSQRAKVMVEFGASFGISTLFLGAAARDNNGILTTCEVHPDKCAALRRTIERTGLGPEVRLLEGDARETLPGDLQAVDFVFLDGWKSLYMPVLELLLPVLGKGAMLVADNVSFDEARSYLDFVRDPDNGFVSSTVGQMEISLLT